MTDNKDGNDFISKTDLAVLLQGLKDEWAQARETERADLLTEFDKRENKIHSSYKNQIKKLAGEDTDKTSKTDTTDEAVQKLLKRAEEADQRAADAEAKSLKASHRNKATEALIKAGFNPKAIDTVHTILDARQALTTDGKLKVSVDGAEIALPLEQAVKYLIKSPEMEFFLEAKTNGGGSKPGHETNSDKPEKLTRSKPVVDWDAVAKDQGDNTAAGGNDGTFAPRFQ